MSKFLNALVALSLMGVTAIGWAKTPTKTALALAEIGRNATVKEVAAWDIDVRPDFLGLPNGSGSVAQGQAIWEAKCAACHGVFGESNEVFSPLVGGTTANDVKTGRVARLLDSSFPGRTTLMKVASLSTLWDYIYRAMPWANPKSLTADEVYAVTAFLLNLGGIVSDDFVLSSSTMAAAQARLPNRNGMTTAHALWPGLEFSRQRKPDILAAACMKNCALDPKITSFLPDFARNAHGNLADQNRGVGAQRGAATSRGEVALGEKSEPLVASRSEISVNTPLPTSPDMRPDVRTDMRADALAVAAIAAQYNCLACHGMRQKIVGPSFADIAKKYPDQADYLAEKVKSGGAGVWGSIPMPAQALSIAEAKLIAKWLASGAGLSQ